MPRTLTSAVASVVSAKFANMVILALVTPVLVRLLGPRLYGEYATTMALFGLLMILVSSGVNSGTRKYMIEDRDEEHWRSHVFGFYVRLAAVLALFGSALLIGAAQAGLVDRLIGEEFAFYFYLLAVLVFASQFGEYTRRTLMGLKLEHLSEPILVMHKVVFGVSAVVLVYLGFGVAGVLAGHIIANLAKAAVSLYYIAQHLTLGAVVRATPEWFPRSTLLNFNHLSIVYVFLLTSLYHVDVLMLEWFTVSEEVGFYKVALVIVEFLWIVPRSLQAVMVQETSDLWRRDLVERITDLSSTVTRFTLSFTVLLGVGLAVLAADFVPVYAGADYGPAIPALLLLLPGTIGFAIARPILTISHARGDLRVMIVATGLSSLINLVLNALLIPLYGIQGAAIATTLGYGSLPVFHVIGARHIGYHPASDLRMGRIAVAGLGMAAVIYPLATVIDNSLVTLAVVPPVGFAVYGLLTLLLGVIDREEVYDVLAGLPAPIDARATSVLRKLNEHYPG